MKAVILFEDGLFLEGKSCGAEGQTAGEVVFNTSMTGYQEILTDPSYKGQIVCMTYPLIGNYGINYEDMESDNVQVEGFILRQNSKIVSNWRAKDSLTQFLKKKNIIAIEGVDTRKITRHIREKGAMKAIISTQEFNKDILQKKLSQIPSIIGRDLVKEVSCKKSYLWQQGITEGKQENLGKLSKHIVVIDCGVKQSILCNLYEQVEKITVVPYTTTIDEVISFNPDGIFFSNGPGDPEAVKPAIELAKQLISGLQEGKYKLVLMGICLGHQILGIALGGKVEKLKFGHHGGNHPVKDLKTGHIDITAQNHNFIVLPDSLKDVLTTHINLYDKTPEGMRHKKLPIFSVQFHPEAGPGPFDARHIFAEFARMMKTF